MFLSKQHLYRFALILEVSCSAANLYILETVVPTAIFSPQIRDFSFDSRVSSSAFNKQLLSWISHTNEPLYRLGKEHYNNQGNTL